MHTKREIRFKTSESKSRLNEGTTCYQGQLIHNRTLDKASTLEAFCNYCHLGEAMPPLYVQLLGGFIAQEIANGNHLDFGEFSVGLKLRGGFPSANAPYDSDRNSLSVEITPSTRIKKAVSSLKPVNALPRRAAFYSIVQIDPEIRDSKSHLMYDTMYSDGSRILSVGAYPCRIHTGASDEGVWIENDAGEIVLTGTVLETDMTLTRIRFDDHLDKGRYWLVVQSRWSDDPNLIRIRHRLTAIPTP